MSFFVNAQCPLKEAVDFSAKDYDGNDINLFEILDRGQYESKKNTNAYVCSYKRKMA